MGEMITISSRMICGISALLVISSCEAHNPHKDFPRVARRLMTESARARARAPRRNFVKDVVGAGIGAAIIVGTAAVALKAHENHQRCHPSKPHGETVTGASCYRKFTDTSRRRDKMCRGEHFSRPESVKTQWSQYGDPENPDNPDWTGRPPYEYNFSLMDKGDD